MKIRKALGVVLLGAVVLILSWHLYLDHRAFHVLVSIEQARQHALQQGRK